MKQYFGHKAQDWELSMLTGHVDGSGQGVEMQKAMANPDQYTTARPNMTTEAAFTVGSKKGAGKDGLTKGPSTAYYKVEKPTSKEPTQQAPAPEPEPEEDLVIKERGPIKHSREIQEAKQRVSNYQQNSPSIQQNFAQAESLDLSKYQFNAAS